MKAICNEQECEIEKLQAELKEKPREIEVEVIKEVFKD